MDDLKLHPLDEVAGLGIAPSVHWLKTRLRRGEISGYRVGTSWMMSDQDIADMLESHRIAAKPKVVRDAGFTKGSQRRRSA